jgi:hypothetical protein
MIDVAAYISFPGNVLTAIEILGVLVGPSDTEGLCHLRMNRNLQPIQMI